MFQLSTFYRSKSWQSLLRKIKSDRVNAEGDIICEYCGKPIVKKFDCIGHHKIHLTPQNVNDVNVSLKQYRELLSQYTAIVKTLARVSNDDGEEDSPLRKWFAKNIIEKDGEKNDV